MSSQLKPIDRELELMFSVVESLQEKPKVNWDQVALKMKYKDGTTAQVRFAQVRKKFSMTYSPTPAMLSSEQSSDDINKRHSKQVKAPKENRTTKASTAGRGRGRPKRSEAVKKARMPKSKFGLYSSDEEEDETDDYENGGKMYFSHTDSSKESTDVQMEDRESLPEHEGSDNAAVKEDNHEGYDEYEL